MNLYVSILALSLLAGIAVAQPKSEQDKVTSTWSERLDSLSKVLDQEKRVLDANAKSLESDDKKANVLRGSPTDDDAAIANGLMKKQHVELWNQTSADIQEFSQKLKDASNQIKEMPPATALQTLNSIVVADRLTGIFSVAKDGRILPDPPHLRSAQDKPRSLGGYVVGPGMAATVDYPAVSEIAYNFEGLGSSTLCTGTLISVNAVLTAAHCFCEFVSASTFARCMTATYKRGLEDLKATDAKYVSVFFQDVGALAVKSIKINPDFAYPKADIAILELAAPVLRIEPAPINRGVSPKKGSIGFVVGFGVHSAVDSSGHPKPKAASPEQGTQGIKTWARVQLGSCAGTDKGKNLICWNYARSAGEDALGSTCKGDSGGPLLINTNGMWSLAGVTSGGRTDCIPSPKSADESYDVDISKYVSWINANVNPVKSTLDDKFIKDRSNRAFDSVYHLFVEQPDKWEAVFEVSSKLPVLNFAVNATPTYSFLQIDLVPPGSSSANCSNRSNDAYVTCSVTEPIQGMWKLSVSGSRPQESQVVGTVAR
jgi:hypothetical protein